MKLRSSCKFGFYFNQFFRCLVCSITTSGRNYSELTTAAAAVDRLLSLCVPYLCPAAFTDGRHGLFMLGFNCVIDVDFISLLFARLNSQASGSKEEKSRSFRKFI